MKILVYQEGMTEAEQKNVGYWERNMLALKYAQGWYNDDVSPDVPRMAGWRRCLCLEFGAYNFHVPDDFDVGNLPQVPPTWDGHTTEEKWRKVFAQRNIVESQ